MDEQRSSARQRTLKAGTIAFDRAAGIDCLLRNISKTGACLEVASPIGVPETFILVVEKDGLKRSCRVAWRSARRIGVWFE